MYHKTLRLAHGPLGFCRSANVFSEIRSLATPYENTFLRFSSPVQPVCSIANSSIADHLEQVGVATHEHTFHRLVFGASNSEADSCHIPMPASGFPVAIRHRYLAAGLERGIPELAAGQSAREIFAPTAHLRQPDPCRWNLH